MLDRISVHFLTMLLSVVVIAACWHISELFGDLAPIFAGLSLQIIGLLLATAGIGNFLKKIEKWLNGIELLQKKKKLAIAGVDPSSLMAVGAESEGFAATAKEPPKQKSVKKTIKELEQAIKRQRKRERQLRERLESTLKQAVSQAHDQVDEETEQLRRQQSELTRINSQRRYLFLGLSWIVAGMLITTKAALIS